MLVREGDAYRLALPEGARIDLERFDEAVLEARGCGLAARPRPPCRPAGRSSRPTAATSCRRTGRPSGRRAGGIARGRSWSRRRARGRAPRGADPAARRRHAPWRWPSIPTTIRCGGSSSRHASAPATRRRRRARAPAIRGCSPSSAWRRRRGVMSRAACRRDHGAAVGLAPAASEELDLGDGNRGVRLLGQVDRGHRQADRGSALRPDVERLGLNLVLQLDVPGDEDRAVAARNSRVTARGRARLLKSWRERRLSRAPSRCRPPV